MKKLASIAAVFLMASTFAFAETWTGKLVDASCKASREGDDSATAGCAATATTHLFAIELPDAKVLDLDAAGNEKASNAVKDTQKTNLHVTVTGSLDGQTVKVETIEIDSK